MSADTRRIRSTDMTLADINAIDREYLLPREVAAVLGCDPQGIRVWAKQNPEGLGFPVVVIGKRVRIPKAAFVAYMTGQKQTVRWAIADGW